MQIHTFLGLLLDDFETPSFKEHCEGMLAEVSQSRPNDRQSAWAQREHIFQAVADLTS